MPTDNIKNEKITSLNIKAKIPIFQLLPFEVDLFEYVDNGIREILSLSNTLTFEISVLGEFQIEIYLENIIPQKNEFHNQLLVFQVIIPNDYKKVPIQRNNSNFEITEDEHRLMFESLMIHDFRAKLHNFLLITNIAKPGVIKAKRGEIFMNEKLIDFSYPITSIHRESLSDIKKIKWPTYLNLKYIDAWNWFKENKFSFERFSRNGSERAMNAFTNLFQEDSNYLAFDLFWSLIGIEAIYCKGKENLSEQIFTKTQVLLGEMSDYKKRLKRMYEFRSRLIHGDLDIPPNNYDYDDENDINFNEELYEATSLAVAILTVTFQRMIEMKKNTIEFTTTTSLIL
ncbi:hypothetical protein FF18_15860 [Elizabethkingia anophelis]|uniref:hypothetical protein n=1 Tax=Elizabethkingia anophelis TaxID=1117645 RepID=UPI0004E3267D|nr:hypothetical protein [Elizabethkingia anophelis]KFC38228.1 hypothetical protein FF18_15860 [Elizabethkingia anophelis]MDV3500532.1 hypothetical protein [Elizabethkingia anophelis]